MLQLPSTKYPNVQRTVTGVVDVFPDDVISTVTRQRVRLQLT
jgi:hypothetical protein